jgi:NADH dehydrogenase
VNQAPRSPGSASQSRTRVVIVGGRFAGLNAAKSLGNRESFDVTLVDRLNHYILQPRLYQVATTALSIQDIDEPLRCLLWRYRNIRVLLGQAARRCRPEVRAHERRHTCL